MGETNVETELLTGAKPPFVAAPERAVLPDGWIEEELAFSGSAVSYRAKGAPAPDGALDLVEDQRADFRTRVVVRRPATVEGFDGTVVVEWFNVSGGLDAPAEFIAAAPELYRSGCAWVGVSAQHIGVMGGPTLVTAPGGDGIQGAGLRTLDPERYESLHHPGDAFAYDIFTQVARAIRAGALLGPLVPERLLAAGQSQSASALTTYVNGVHPRVSAFDGFLVHGRGSGGASLGEPGKGIELLSTFSAETTTIRADLDVPVLALETETDVSILGYHRARQDDTDRFRAWEYAGTAHADRGTVGPFAERLDCGGPINDGPQRYAVRAALRALDRWVRTGEAPPRGERLVVGDDGYLVRDEDGIAVGGVRSPMVDVPVAALSGNPRTTANPMCFLMGATDVFTPDDLAARYESAASYLAAYEKATDAAIAAGFLLADDRDELLAEARPDLLSGPSTA